MNAEGNKERNINEMLCWENQSLNFASISLDVTSNMISLDRRLEGPVKCLEEIDSVLIL